MNVRTLAAAFWIVLVPLAATATPKAAHPRSVAAKPAQSGSCTVSSATSPGFGTLTNPVATLQQTNGALQITCGQGTTAAKLSFSDVTNSGTFNFTLTNSSTSSATQTFQICDQSEFTGTSCPSGYEYKDSPSDLHAVPVSNQYYFFTVFFNPPPGGVNLTTGFYVDTLTETISF